MSLKKLLGMEMAAITDNEIMARVKEAQDKNLDSIEFDIEGSKVKISLPHVSFDPWADRDSW